jgi:hypothetical protein
MVIGEKVTSLERGVKERGLPPPLTRALPNPEILY